MTSSSDDVAEACVLAGAFHAATLLFAALGFLTLGFTRAAAGAALMGVLLWAASMLHWLVARFAQRRMAQRAPRREARATARGPIAATR